MAEKDNEKEIEKREKREEKRDGFQPFHPGPWNNFELPYGYGPQFPPFYSYPGPWNNFGFPYGYGPQFPPDLIKEFLPAKTLGGREEVSSSAKSLGGHNSPIRHPNVEELKHEVKMETKNKNSHFEGLKNPPKFENHDVKFQKDRDSLLVKLLEEQRELRKGSVRKRSEIEKSTNLCTLDEKKVDGGGGDSSTSSHLDRVWGGGTLPKDTFITCRGGGVSPQTTISHGGRTDMG
jgi:hypothetical protein